MQSFQFPLKGIDRTVARSAQPIGTAVDMLNVIPYDGAGRARGGQRLGTVKLQDDALAGGIMLLAQNTIILDPDDFDPLVDNIFDPFTYSDGGLGTTGNPPWTTFNSFQPANSDTDALTVSTNAIYGGNGYTGGVLARYDGTAVVSDAYTASITVTADDVQDIIVGLLANIPTGASPDLTYSVFAQVSLYPSGGSYTTILLSLSVDGTEAGSVDITGSITPNVPFTIYLKREGQKFTTWTDASENRLTLEASGVNDTAKVGFVLSTSTPNASLTSFDDYTLTNVQAVGERAVYRGTVLIAVAGGNIYTGDLTSVTLATGGTAALDATVQPQVAFFEGKAYFVDGTSDVQVLDIPTNTVSTFSPTAGTETATTLGEYRLAATWHGRIVFANSLQFPQNFVMSRVGTPTDFDYADTDAGAAFAGNLSTAGRIGEPIIALLPLSDDVIAFGGDHTMWAMRGDPAVGGSIDMVSEAIGVVGPNAWTKAPDGTVYFVGPGAFFRMPGNAGPPVDISSIKYPQFFAELNRATNYISCAWDRDKHGCYIFVNPVTGALGTSLWYDARTEGFFPLEYPTSHGPITALVYDGDGADDRVVILGGTDGYLRLTDDTALTDDGTAISSFVFIGPFQVGKGLMTDGIINGLDLTLGEPQEGIATSFMNVDVAVYVARDAYNVTQGTPRNVFSRTYTGLPGRVTSLRPRLRGAWGMIKLSNTIISTTWSFETITYTADVLTGKTRR